MTLLGGMGTVFGPIAGAAIVVGLQNYAGGLGEWVTVITGAIFVICVLAFRRGIIGELAALFESRRQTEQEAEAEKSVALGSSER